MKKREDISIAAIAEKCGVSAMTVSRALRGNGVVREQTRVKIVEAAEELGYIRSPRLGRPAHKASSLGKVEIVAGITGGNMAFFHSNLITSIEQQLAECGYDCIIRTCSGEYGQFLQLMENIRGAKADATMLIGSFQRDHLKTLLEAVPDALLLDNPGDPSIELPYESFSFDNIEAARIGIRHLFNSGRKKILLVSGSKEHFFSREIEQGYRELYAARGMDIDKDLIVNTDFTSEGAHDVVSAILDNKIEFDAVFTNDEMASGVYRALFERGLKIPEDVAICGCDGLPVGMHLFPRLTTVKLDYQELGSRAIRHLLHERKLNSSVCRVRLLPQLEVRESSVC
jgi:LacI family transcriptional regulator